MSNESEETSTNEPTDVLGRLWFAQKAAEILILTRRPAPFGNSALPADQIIALAEYLHHGPPVPVEPESEPEGREFFDPMLLQVNDVISYSGQPYRVVEKPVRSGDIIVATVRPEPGGVAHPVSWATGSTVEIIQRQAFPPDSEL